MYPADSIRSDAEIHTRIHFEAVLGFARTNSIKIAKQPMTEKEHDTRVRQAVPNDTQAVAFCASE